MEYNLPVISVVIPTYRRFEVLIDTIRYVLAQDYQGFELIVVDQNKNWPEELHSELNEIKTNALVKWIHLDKPGVVAARNEGVKTSTGEILLFIDDDVEIKDRYFLLKHAINYRDTSIDAVTGRELYPMYTLRPALSTYKPENGIDTKTTDTSWKQYSNLKQIQGFSRSSEHRAEVCTLSTCNCSIRRTTFLKFGGFDENFRGNSYGDDYDIALRMAAGNARIIYDPEPWLIHLKSPIGGLRLSDQANVFSEREKAVCLFIFLFRHGARGYYLNLLWNHVIRKTVLLRRNVMEPWRQPKVWWGLLSAIPEAVKVVNHGPISRFTN